MNDRYLYRAKRIDNGEWVEGLLTIMWGQIHIINPNDENTAYPIDEKTICQFTGLLDKNGNKIWENDIVDTHNRGHGYSRLEKVIYENGGFFPISTHGWECEPDADEIEVIGNVFDNAELVK